MMNIQFRPAEPDQDFATLAEWFNVTEGSPNSNTKDSLVKYYNDSRDRTVQAVAEDEHGVLLGFYWGRYEPSNPQRAYFDLLVAPQYRGRGIGRHLYKTMLDDLSKFKIQALRVRVLDSSPVGLTFIRKLGYLLVNQSIAMSLDLDTFDFSQYDPLIVRLEAEGYNFTSMAELGDTEEARRKEFYLNNISTIETPGSDGEPGWQSFEEFNQGVCSASWYLPEGQMIVVDTHNGEFVAMSAITRFESSSSAYNLHTGVLKAYRGRKLAQAVKVTALRFARDVLQVQRVDTHHNFQNDPMIAIDKKFGYKQTQAVFTFEKRLC